MTKDDDTKPKLPKQQLTILAIARFAEPLAYTSVFPYLPEMIRDFGVSQNEIAKWAGLTSAIFSVFQSITAVPWGKAADKYGRKPVLIVGLLSTMVCFVLWGMSTSLTMAIIVRAIQGGGNGNVGIIRTVVAELVTAKELQPRAFSIMPLVWSLGSVLGPSLGGFFAQPAKQYPALFGDIAFFKRFPYALPNFVLTLFFLVSVASASLFLKETLASKRDNEDRGLIMGKKLTRAFQPRRPSTLHHRRTSFVDGEATAPLIPSKLRVKQRAVDELPPPGMSEVFTKQTSINLVAYAFLAFHSVAWDQNVTVFLNYPKLEHTPENTKFPFYFNGGFGLTSGEIGTIFTCYGIACGLIQFLMYSPLVTRFGVLRCFRACSLLLPFVYILTPYTAVFPTATGRYTALAVLMLFKAAGIIIAFPSTTILLTNSCISLRILGTLNGVATTFSGLGRALGPSTTGWAFSWGADNGYIVTAYFFLGLVAAIGAIPVFMIVEGDGPSVTPPLSPGGSQTDHDESDETEDDAEGERAGLLSRESTFLNSSEYENEGSAASSKDNVTEPLLGAGKMSDSGYRTLESSSK